MQIKATLSAPPPCAVCKSEDHGHIPMGPFTYACPEKCDFSGSMGFSVSGNTITVEENLTINTGGTMDPNATLQDILNALATPNSNKDILADNLENLAEWIRKGGAKPTLSTLSTHWSDNAGSYGFHP